MASFINIYQGSDIQGVPASDINAISFQLFKSEIIFSIFILPE